MKSQHVCVWRFSFFWHAFRIQILLLWLLFMYCLWKVIFDFSTLFSVLMGPVYCLWDSQISFSVIFSLKMNSTILFIHLKLFYYSIFQFSVVSKWALTFFFFFFFLGGKGRGRVNLFLFLNLSLRTVFKVSLPTNDTFNFPKTHPVIYLFI